MRPVDHLDAKRELRSRRASTDETRMNAGRVIELPPVLSGYGWNISRPPSWLTAVEPSRACSRSSAARSAESPPVLSAWRGCGMSPSIATADKPAWASADAILGTMPAGVVASSPRVCELAPTLSANGCAFASSTTALSAVASRARARIDLADSMVFLVPLAKLVWRIAHPEVRPGTPAAARFPQDAARVRAVSRTVAAGVSSRDADAPRMSRGFRRRRRLA